MNENKILKNKLPTIIDLVWRFISIGLIIFVIIFMFIPSINLKTNFISGSNSTYLIIMVVWLLVMVSVLFDTFKILIFVTTDSRQTPLSKSTEIKDKKIARSRSSTLYYIVDGDKKKYKVSSEIYNAFEIGDTVTINYYPITTYLDSIAAGTSSIPTVSKDDLIKIV